MNKRYNKIILSTVIFSVFLFITHITYAGSEVEKLIKEVRKASEKIDSYKVSYILKIKKEKGEVHSRGYIEYKEPKKFYMEIGLSGMKSVKQIFVSNGKQVWEFIPEMGLASKIDLSKVDNKKVDEYLDKRGDLRDPFENLNRNSIDILKESAGGKRNLYVIKAKPKKGVKKNTIIKVKSVKIWINSELGIPKKILWYNSQGEVVIKQEFKKIELNPDLKDSRFEFNPPKGIKVMDVTNEVK